MEVVRDTDISVLNKHEETKMNKKKWQDYCRFGQSNDQKDKAGEICNEPKIETKVCPMRMKNGNITWLFCT